MDVGCYACGEPTRRRCRECRRPYCNQHGDVICDECGERAELAARRLPVSVVYSPVLLRSVLVLIVVGILFAAAPDVWARLSPAPQAAAPVETPATRPVSTPEQIIVPPSSVSPTAAATAAITATATVTATAAATATVTETPSGPVIIRYTVAEGDDLRSIAERFEVSTEAIISYNNLADPDNLQPGEVLLIPK